MYIGCGCTGCCRLGETPSGLSGELASGSAFTIYLIAAGSIPAVRTIIGLALFSIVTKPVSNLTYRSTSSLLSKGATWSAGIT